MSERYTKSDAQQAFERLCRVLDKVNGHYRAMGADEDLAPGAVGLGADAKGRPFNCSIPGGWALDYNSVYGGFVVEELCYGSTGITHPFGSNRRPAREFVQMVRDIINAITALESTHEITPKTFAGSRS